MEQVEVEEVVIQEKVRALGLIVEPDQHPGQAMAATGKREGSTGVWSHAAQGVIVAVVPPDLQVQGQAVREGEKPCS